MNLLDETVEKAVDLKRKICMYVDVDFIFTPSKRGTLLRY